MIRDEEREPSESNIVPPSALFPMDDAGDPPGMSIDSKCDDELLFCLNDLEGDLRFLTASAQKPPITNNFTKSALLGLPPCPTDSCLSSTSSGLRVFSYESDPIDSTLAPEFSSESSVSEGNNKMDFFHKPITNADFPENFLVKDKQNLGGNNDVVVARIASQVTTKVCDSFKGFGEADKPGQLSSINKNSFSGKNGAIVPRLPSHEKAKKPKSKAKDRFMPAPPTTKHRHWTHKEDNTLRLAMGNEDRDKVCWKRIAGKYFDNTRSAQQCKVRWTNVSTL